jgi:hypothetical protein
LKALWKTEINHTVDILPRTLSYLFLGNATKYLIRNRTQQGK